jgi:polyisoprenoid-binding protein YceI
MRGGSIAVLFGLVGLLASGASLSAQSPIASGTVIAGTLSFDGHATVGDFVGTTSTVTGELTGGPSLSGVRGWVEAPVKTLVTGKGKRDADLNKSMESDQYPMIRYQLDSITPGASTGDTIAVTLHGQFIIHGVTRAAVLPGRVVLGPAQSRVWANTPLNLKDYKIGGLSKALGFLKMHENIEVHVDVTFGHSDPEAPR